MGERGPQPGEGGAPRKVIDLDVARRAASLGCSSDEIATLLGIGRRTFFDHLKEDEDLKNAIDAGRDQGRTTLRRLQWQRAQTGSDTMLIWLGKQLLGQRDKHEFAQDPASPPITLLHLVAMREVGEAIVASLASQQVVIDGGTAAEIPPAELSALGVPAPE
jgi:hypothetical protein